METHEWVIFFVELRKKKFVSWVKRDSQLSAGEAANQEVRRLVRTIVSFDPSALLGSHPAVPFLNAVKKCARRNRRKLRRQVWPIVNPRVMYTCSADVRGFYLEKAIQQCGSASEDGYNSVPAGDHKQVLALRAVAVERRQKKHADVVSKLRAHVALCGTDDVAVSVRHYARNTRIDVTLGAPRSSARKTLTTFFEAKTWGFERETFLQQIKEFVDALKGAAPGISVHERAAQRAEDASVHVYDFEALCTPAELLANEKRRRSQKLAQKNAASDDEDDDDDNSDEIDNAARRKRRKK